MILDLPLLKVALLVRISVRVQGHGAVLQQHLQQQPMLALNMGPHAGAHLAQQAAPAQAQPTEVSATLAAPAPHPSLL